MPSDPTADAPTPSAARHGKALALRLLRGAGLLQPVDSLRLALARARAAPANRRFRRQHPGFPLPPPHLAYDALNHVDAERYRRSGLCHAAVFARLMQELLPGSTPLRVLEWGCGPGRLIRHLPALLPDRRLALTGADYNPQSIDWCRRHLPQAEFVDNGLLPPLPLPDGGFDVVYAFSVFTHLSEPVQLAWATELLRVLRPGGWLICTTHGDAYRHLLAAPAEREAYAQGQAVAQTGYREGRKWFLALHPPAFVRGRLLAGWAGVRQAPTTPAEDMLQDVWVARRPG